MPVKNKLSSVWSVIQTLFLPLRWIGSLLARGINWWVHRWETYRKARKDYENCRGTTQKKSLKRDLQKLDSIITELENRKQKLDTKKDGLQRTLIPNVNQYAAKKLIENYHHEIEGIGSTYKDKIINRIDRLHHSRFHKGIKYSKIIPSIAENIQGIGQKKRRKLKYWFRKNSRTITKTKKEVKKKNNSLKNKQEKIDSLENSIEEIKTEISKKKEIYNNVEEKYELLNEVTSYDFWKVRYYQQKHTELANDVSGYLKGLYPPWKDEPEWRNELNTALKDRKNNQA